MTVLDVYKRQSLIPYWNSAVIDQVDLGSLSLTGHDGILITVWLGISIMKQYGLVQVTDASPLVMIEYSSPNTNKPLHLGHVRNNLLGNALANIVAANGNKVGSAGSGGLVRGEGIVVWQSLR